MATTVYVLTFDAQWLESGCVIRGQQAYPVTCSSGELDMASAIAACQIIAATAGTILFPEHSVDIRTFVWEYPALAEPLWDDAGVRVY